MSAITDLVSQFLDRLRATPVTARAFAKPDRPSAVVRVAEGVLQTMNAPLKGRPTQR